MPATWIVQDPALHKITASHFVRITGLDGAPGFDGDSTITTWGAPIDTATGLPDLTDAVKAGTDGWPINPRIGDWVLTNNDGDIKLWRVEAGGAFSGPVDLPDGPVGAAGSAAPAQHTHDIEPPAGVPSYAALRDRYVGLKFVVGDTRRYVP